MGSWYHCGWLVDTVRPRLPQAPHTRQAVEPGADGTVRWLHGSTAPTEAEALATAEAYAARALGCAPADVVLFHGRPQQATGSPYTYLVECEAHVRRNAVRTTPKRPTIAQRLANWWLRTQC